MGSLHFLFSSTILFGVRHLDHLVGKSNTLTATTTINYQFDARLIIIIRMSRNAKVHGKMCHRREMNANANGILKPGGKRQ